MFVCVSLFVIGEEAILPQLIQGTLTLIQLCGVPAVTEILWHNPHKDRVLELEGDTRVPRETETRGYHVRLAGPLGLATPAPSD